MRTRVFKSEEEVQEIFSNPANYREMDWDVEIDGRPYKVVKIKGFGHSLVIYGVIDILNEFWCYPLNEAPSYLNLLKYKSIEHPGPIWGIQLRPYLAKTADGSVVYREYAEITRNDKVFYNELMTYEQAYHILEKIIQHPINFQVRDYEKAIVNRKVWWNYQPGIITKWLPKQCRVLIESEDGYKFRKPAYLYSDEINDIETLNKAERDLYYEEDYPICESIFSSSIIWFRD